MFWGIVAIAVLLQSSPCKSQEHPVTNSALDEYCDTDLEPLDASSLQHINLLQHKAEGRKRDNVTLSHNEQISITEADGDAGRTAKPITMSPSTMNYYYGPGSPTELKFIHIPKHAGRSIMEWGNQRGFAWSNYWIDPLGTLPQITIIVLCCESILLLSFGIFWSSSLSGKNRGWLKASILTLSCFLPLFYCCCLITYVIMLVMRASAPRTTHAPATLFAAWHAPPIYFESSPYRNYPERFMVVANPYEHMIKEFRCEYHGYMAVAFGPVLLDFSGGPILRITSPHRRMLQRKNANATDLNRWIVGILQHGPAWWWSHIPYHTYMLSESGGHHVHMNNVLHLETLDEDFKNLTLRYGLELGSLPHVGEVDDMPDFGTEDLEETTLRMIEDWFGHDFDLFMYPRLSKSAQSANATTKAIKGTTAGD